LGATELGMGDNESVQALVLRILIQNEASLRKKCHANSNRGTQCRSSGWNECCVTGMPQKQVSYRVPGIHLSCFMLMAYSFVDQRTGRAWCYHD